MTPERRAELEALCAAATPGPWEATDNHVTMPGIGAVEIFTENPITGDSSNDTAFIAASRTALPEALAEIDRLHQRWTALKAEADDFGRQPEDNLYRQGAACMARTLSDRMARLERQP